MSVLRTPQDLSGWSNCKSCIAEIGGSRGCKPVEAPSATCYYMLWSAVSRKYALGLRNCTKGIPSASTMLDSVGLFPKVLETAHEIASSWPRLPNNQDFDIWLTITHTILSDIFLSRNLISLIHQVISLVALLKINNGWPTAPWHDLTCDSLWPMCPGSSAGRSKLHRWIRCMEVDRGEIKPSWIKVR